MHKLGEGLGGWTTRYFTLTYELSVTMPGGASAPAHVKDLESKKERPRPLTIATEGAGSAIVRLHKASHAEKLGLTFVEDDEGKVTISRVHSGYLAANSAALNVGDRVLAINGAPASGQRECHKILSETDGAVELQVQRASEAASWMLRYHDEKNAVERVEKGCIKVRTDLIRSVLVRPRPGLPLPRLPRSEIGPE